MKTETKTMRMQREWRCSEELPPPAENLRCGMIAVLDDCGKVVTPRGWRGLQAGETIQTGDFFTSRVWTKQGFRVSRWFKTTCAGIEAINIMYFRRVG